MRGWWAPAAWHSMSCTYHPQNACSGRLLQSACGAVCFDVHGQRDDIDDLPPSSLARRVGEVGVGAHDAAVCATANCRFDGVC